MCDFAFRFACKYLENESTRIIKRKIIIIIRMKKGGRIVGNNGDLMNTLGLTEKVIRVGNSCVSYTGESWQSILLYF